MAINERIRKAAHYLKSQVQELPRHTIVLGTGLKDITNQFSIKYQTKLSKIPHFPRMTVHHMDATLYLATHQGILFWILGGRLHYYEGYTMAEVTFPIRVLAETGTQSFFFTNAAGNVNPSFAAGNLVLIRDHINWSFPSPLIGPNNEKWGPRYPFMSEVYDPKFINMLLEFSEKSGLQLDTGVYLGVTGPQLETPAEYRLFRQLGADMVGMSTIPEVIIAAHMNRQITALSVLSNDAVDTPTEDSTDITEILNHIKSRIDDVAELIKYWLKMVG